MTALVAIVGFVVGYAYWRFPGGLQGALFGYLLANVLDLRTRLRDLEGTEARVAFLDAACRDDRRRILRLPAGGQSLGDSRR